MHGLDARWIGRLLRHLASHYRAVLVHKSTALRGQLACATAIARFHHTEIASTPMGCPFARAAASLRDSAMEHCPFLRSLIDTTDEAPPAMATRCPFKASPACALVETLAEPRAFLETYEAMHGEHGVLPTAAARNAASSSVLGLSPAALQRCGLVRQESAAWREGVVQQRPQFASLTLGGAAHGMGSVRPDQDWDLIVLPRLLECARGVSDNPSVHGMRSLKVLDLVVERVWSAPTLHLRANRIVRVHRRGCGLPPTANVKPSPSFDVPPSTRVALQRLELTS
jgi:hypothetical protein